MVFPNWGGQRPPYCQFPMFPGRDFYDIAQRVFPDSNQNNDTRESKVEKTQEFFKICLDVSKFQPEDLTVKVIENRQIQVEGKHEDKEDEHGSVSRHFVRKYIVPEEYDLGKVESKVTPDGKLVIVVQAINANRTQDIPIPIIRETN